MNELGIILCNKTIWITKSQLLTIAVLAFAIYILICILQPWIEPSQQDRQLTLYEALRISLPMQCIICLGLFLYLSFF